MCWPGKPLLLSVIPSSVPGRRPDAILSSSSRIRTACCYAQGIVCIGDFSKVLDWIV